MMSTKHFYLLLALTTIFLLLVSIYLQIFDGFIPCPLCTLQRFSFGILALLFLIGFFIRKRLSHLILTFFTMITSLLGISLAARQVWLQHFPPPNSECGVSLEYMLKVLPTHQVLQKVFEGSAECTQSGSWSFLTLDMAEWALIWFILFLFLSLILFIKKYKS